MYINKKIIPLPAVNILLILSIKLWSYKHKCSLVHMYCHTTTYPDRVPLYLASKTLLLHLLRKVCDVYMSMLCVPFEKNNKEKTKSDI